MPRLEALDESEYGDLAESFRAAEQRLGVVPNSVKIMARRPDITRTWSAMSAAIMGPGNLDRGLKTMVGHISSRAAGCNYCMAHTAHAGELAGIPLEKAEALWDFERSPLFDEAERAALRVAAAAGAVPNAVSDADFDDLKKHFDDTRIVELVAVIAMYGFLNRWNDTLATELESAPLAFGRAHLAEQGWSPEKHLRKEPTE